MAKNKYDENTFPLIAEGMAREGALDKDIARALNISQDTFYRYVKEHPEFSESLKRGKAPVNYKVENALLKRCLGYNYVEVTKEMRPVGKDIVPVIKKVIKHVPPDVTACIFWLKNRMPEKWRDRKIIDIIMNEKWINEALEDLKTYTDLEDFDLSGFQEWSKQFRTIEDIVGQNN